MFHFNFTSQRFSIVEHLRHRFSTVSLCDCLTIADSLNDSSFIYTNLVFHEKKKWLFLSSRIFFASQFSIFDRNSKNSPKSESIIKFFCLTSRIISHLYLRIDGMHWRRKKYCSLHSNATDGRKGFYIINTSALVMPRWMHFPLITMRISFILGHRTADRSGEKSRSSKSSMTFHSNRK